MEWQSGLQPSQSTTTPNQVAKDWREDVTVECRNSLVDQLVEAMCPNNLYQTMKNEKKKPYIAYAKKIENDTYVLADSKESYLYLINMDITGYNKQRNKLDPQVLQQEQQQQFMSTPNVATTSSTDILPGTEQQQPEQQHFDNSNAPVQFGLTNRNVTERLDNLFVMQMQLPFATALTIPITKPWQRSVKEELREHVVNTVLHMTFLNFCLESELKNFTEYAKKLEGDTFIESNSSSEYYYVCVEKMLNIRKIEIEDKLKKLEEMRIRMEQQQQQLNPNEAGPSRVDNNFMNVNANALFKFQLPGELMLIKVITMIGNVTWEYQKAVCPAYREFMLNRLIHAIFRNASPLDKTHEMVQNTIVYAKKLEADIYVTAKTWSDYNRLNYAKIDEFIKNSRGSAADVDQQLPVLAEVDVQPGTSQINETAKMTYEVVPPNDETGNNRLSGISTRLLRRLQQPQIIDVPDEDTKSWRKSITSFTRSHMRYKCMQAIDSDFKPDSDTPSKSLIKHSKKLEKRLLYKSKSLSEYLNFSQDKILELAKSR